MPEKNTILTTKENLEEVIKLFKGDTSVEIIIVSQKEIDEEYKKQNPGVPLPPRPPPRAPPPEEKRYKGRFLGIKYSAKRSDVRRVLKGALFGTIITAATGGIAGPAAFGSAFATEVGIGAAVNVVANCPEVKKHKFLRKALPIAVGSMGGQLSSAGSITAAKTTADTVKGVVTNEVARKTKSKGLAVALGAAIDGGSKETVIGKGFNAEFASQVGKITGNKHIEGVVNVGLNHIDKVKDKSPIKTEKEEVAKVDKPKTSIPDSRIMVEDSKKSGTDMKVSASVSPSLNGDGILRAKMGNGETSGGVYLKPDMADGRVSLGFFTRGELPRDKSEPAMIVDSSKTERVSESKTDVCRTTFYQEKQYGVVDGKPTVEVRTGVETDMDCINDGLKTAHTAVLLAPVAIEAAAAGLAIPPAIPGSLIPLAAEISK